MSQTGYTPIKLYNSITAAAAPSSGNLENGELAINIRDGKLFYKDNLGVVQTIATTSSAAGIFTGTPSAPTAAVGTNTTQISTTAFVQAALQAALPAGVITMWSGSIASIPAGWALCNGSGGTPDLRDRFVIGAGSTYAVAATGGDTTVTLSLASMPAHTHTGTTDDNNVGHFHGVSGNTGTASANHVHSGTTNNAGAHSHGLFFGTGGAGGNTSAVPASSGSVIGPIDGAVNGVGDHQHGFTTDGSGADHFHGFSTTSEGVSANHVHSFTTSSQGSGTAFGILPPYYALAYIMKL